MKRQFILVSAVVMSAAVLGSLALWGCTKPSSGTTAQNCVPVFEQKSSKGQVIATVGDSVITKQDFEERLNRLNPYLRSRYQSLEQKKKLLDVMIRNDALAQEAMKLGLHKDAKIIEQLKSELANATIKSEFDGKMKDSLVTDEDVKKYYEEHIDQYKRPETVRVSMMFFEKGARAKAEAILRQAKKEANDRRSFTKLAKEHSMDSETNLMGGDLNYMTSEELAQKYGEPFAKAAFELQNTNDISPLVETEKGFYILTLRGKRQAIDRPLDKVESSIKSRLYYSKRTEALDKWVEEVKTRLKVKVNDEALGAIKVDTAEVPAPGDLTPEGQMRPIRGEKALKAKEEAEKEEGKAEAAKEEAKPEAKPEGEVQPAQ